MASQRTWNSSLLLLSCQVNPALWTRHHSMTKLQFNTYILSCALHCTGQSYADVCFFSLAYKKAFLSKASSSGYCCANERWLKVKRLCLAVQNGCYRRCQMQTSVPSGQAVTGLSVPSNNVFISMSVMIKTVLAGRSCFIHAPGTR